MMSVAIGAKSNMQTRSFIARVATYGHAEQASIRPLWEFKTKYGGTNMLRQSRNLITVVLTVFLSVAFVSINAFAARTTVTVTNDTPYPLRAVYKAVGCLQILSGSVDGNEVDDTGYHIHNQTPEVCDYKYVAPGDTVSYEFGGGTSGRKVWAEIYSATPEMFNSSSSDQEGIDVWNVYVGNSAIIKDSWSWEDDLYDNGSNSCAVKGFGILHDAHVTWTKIAVHEYYVGTGQLLFRADCGGVVSQPEAKFVSVGECETLVSNRAIDLQTLQQVVGVLADDCTANAKNHGQVISCITRELNTLVKDNVISGEERGAIRACALQAVPRGKY